MLAFHVLSLSTLATAIPQPWWYGQPPQKKPVYNTPAGLIDSRLNNNARLNYVQQNIKDYLRKAQSPQDGSRVQKPWSCMSWYQASQCCICKFRRALDIYSANAILGYDVSAELTRLFLGADGQCNDNARAAVRMAFHDAGSWDKTQVHGGADGSLLMDFGEIDRPENNGLQNIRLVLRGVQQKFNVGYADLVQYAHNHAVVTCPRGPSIRTFVGRKDAVSASPEGFLPNVHDKADNLVAIFENKGFSAEDLAALLGAHSVGRQRFVDTRPEAVNKAFDTSIGVWDVEFYNDTLNNESGSSAKQKIFVLPSDKVLSTHPKLNEEWKKFVGDQKHWNEDYAKAAIRMSTLGVRNVEELEDCTRTLPWLRG